MDNPFLKSIERFGACIQDEGIRKGNYEKLLCQERLAEKYYELCQMIKV